MKKIIITSLCFSALVFFLGGIYIIKHIEQATSKQDYLIMLHQVELLREQLLMHIQQVQSNVNLLKTKYAKDTDTVISSVLDMEKVAGECSQCHHSPEVAESINELYERIADYKASISRVLTIHANTTRVIEEEDKAFQIAEDLMDRVDTMVHFTNAKLLEKTDEILADIRNTKMTVYGLIALTPIFVVLFSSIFIRELTNPVRTLLEATRKLKSGDLDHRIEGLKDEFGEVAKSFNEMAGSLKEQMLNMQRTEQMAVLGELSAGLAHEIKNPLAGIKVSVEVLAEDLNISDEDRMIVFQAVDRINQIDQLLKSLLDFARPPRPQFAVVDINKILDKTIDFSMRHPSLALNTQTAITISRDYEDNLPGVFADPTQIEHAFLNLLFNAIEAMSEGGALGVKTRYDVKKDCIEVAISDTGDGIDKESLDKIFQPFFTTKRKGTGLGLAVTKRFVEQNSGDIYAKSERGKGTVFYIILRASKGKKEELK